MGENKPLWAKSLWTMARLDTRWTKSSSTDAHRPEHFVRRIHKIRA